MKNTLSKILAMVIAVLMVASMFSFAAFAAADDVTADSVATADEPVVETKYYLVGYINGADYGIEGDWANNGDYLFVDGTVTVELTQDSYVIVKDENGVGYWTDGWKDMNPGTVTLGEFGTNNNKMHVAAGVVAFTFDAETLTLTATPVVDEPEVETPDEPVVDITPDEPVVETPDEPVVTPDEPVVTPDEPVVTPDEPAANIYGDVDLNGKVNVKDATLIQKAIADLATLDELQAALADVNADGKVNVKDATEIQKWIAELSDNAIIGTDYDAETAPETPEVEIPEVETPDEPVVETPDEPVVETPDEPVVEETKYYLVGYINGADYGIEADWANLGDYLFVDGTVTVEITQDSYVIVKDENGVGYWTDGWLDFGPTSATLGEFGGNNNKMHVAAGTVTFTWDAETLTLSIG